MEKRVSPLKIEEESKKKPAPKKTVKAKKEIVVPAASIEPRPVAKRANPITLNPAPEQEEIKVQEKIVEKIVEVVKEVPATYEPALKVDGLKVNRKLKLFFKLSTVLVDALTKKHPNTPLNINVENAVLDGLKASDKDLYELVAKELKGE